MLIIVFVFYMRMVNSRFDSNKHQSQITLMLEKIAILESSGDDRAALKMAKESLQIFPKNQRIKDRITLIEKRLSRHSS